jgi:hypothetical protein
MSLALSRPLSTSTTPLGAVRVRGTANQIIEGGAGIRRQRQAAVPWLSIAPSPAANRAATSCPSSVRSPGATAEYTPECTRKSLPARTARPIDERLPPAASSCARLTMPSCEPAIA